MVEIPDEKLEQAIEMQQKIIDIMQIQDSKFFGTTLKADHVTPLQLRISSEIVLMLQERGKL
jgi:hypothetical protein